MAKPTDFNIWALLLGPFWFIGNGMWTRGSTLLMILGASLYVSSLISLSPYVPLIAINFYCAATAEGFRKAYLERKNFK